MKSVDRLLREIHVAKAIATFRVQGVKHGRRPTMEYRPVIIRNRGSMKIGKRAAFSGAEARCLLQTHEGASMLIGDNAYVNAGTSIISTLSVEIGDDVKIAGNVAISDSGGHEITAGAGIRSAPVRIGNNVWIGRGATVLAGVTIGENAIVGAGAVVTRDVESDTVVGGAPARFIRRLPPSTGPRK